MQIRTLLLAAAVAALGLTTAGADARPRITIYEHVGYEGASRSFTRDENDLRREDFNDQVSSVRVEDGVWELCEHVNFGGRCIRFGHDNPNLVPLGFNDTASSLRLVGDDRDGDVRDHRGGGRGDDGDIRDHRADIVLYEHVNYDGDQRRLDGDARDLTRIDFNDVVSSLRIRRGVWEVCEHVRYGGRCMTFNRDVPNLVSYGFNDMISSVRRIR